VDGVLLLVRQVILMQYNALQMELKYMYGLVQTDIMLHHKNKQDALLAHLFPIAYHVLDI